MALLLSCVIASAQEMNSEHAQKTLEIYTHIIGVEIAKNLGLVAAFARASSLIFQVVLSPSLDRQTAVSDPDAAHHLFGSGWFRQRPTIANRGGGYYLGRSCRNKL